MSFLKVLISQPILWLVASLAYSPLLLTLNRPAGVILQFSGGAYWLLKTWNISAWFPRSAKWKVPLTYSATVLTINLIINLVPMFVTTAIAFAGAWVLLFPSILEMMRESAGRSKIQVRRYHDNNQTQT